jgi:hypothetical protein
VQFYRNYTAGNTNQKYRIKSQETDFKSQIHERKLSINQPYHAAVMQEERIPKRHVVRGRMDIHVQFYKYTWNEEGIVRVCLNRLTETK